MALLFGHSFSWLAGQFVPLVGFGFCTLAPRTPQPFAWLPTISMKRKIKSVTAKSSLHISPLLSRGATEAALGGTQLLYGIIA